MKTKNLLKKALVVLTCFSFAFAPEAVFAGKITVKGSDTIVIVAQRWAEAYMNDHSDVTIQVTGGGSGTGIAALINGTTDIANASRPIKAKEIKAAEEKTGKTPKRYKVAMDAISVVVNKDNPIVALTMKQIAGIYIGAINNWKEVGGRDEKILRYSRESNSGTYVFFKERVMKKMDYAPDCQTMPGTSAVADAVSRDPKGIGYGGIAYFMTRPDLKIVSVKKEDSGEAVSPVKNGAIDYSSIYSEHYPISRYLNCYTLGEPSAEIAKYLEWILSDEGQKIVKDIGYIPMQ